MCIEAVADLIPTLLTFIVLVVFHETPDHAKYDNARKIDFFPLFPREGKHTHQQCLEDFGPEQDKPCVTAQETQGVTKESQGQQHLNNPVWSNSLTSGHDLKHSSCYGSSAWMRVSNRFPRSYHMAIARVRNKTSFSLVKHEV